MSSFVNNALKKRVKQLHRGYVKLKVTKNSDKQKEDCDKSGLYKAEPTEELYERLILIPEIPEYRRNSKDSGTTTTSNTTHKSSSPIPCSSKNLLSNSTDSSVKSSRDTLEDTSPTGSLDSGISRATPPGFKKLKKLQFSLNSDEVHVFKPNALEQVTYRDSNKNDTKPKLYKTKIYEVPTLKNVKVVNVYSKSDQSDANLRKRKNCKVKPTNYTSESSCDDIPFVRMRSKKSVVSPKACVDTNIYSNDKHLKESFEYNNNSNFSSDKENQDPHDTTYLGENSSSSLPKTPPKKPPRSSKNLKRIALGVSAVNFLQDRRYVGYNHLTSLTENEADASPVRRDKKEICSTPINQLLNAEVYMNTTSTPTTLRSSNTINGVEYAVVTPRRSRNIDTNPTSKPSVNLVDSLTNPPASFTPDANSTLNNNFLSKEIKESLNLIHQTNHSLKLSDITQTNKCHNKTFEEQCIEKKFVVNMFESRPSKRWERHIRSKEQLNNSNEVAFDRATLKRRSLNLEKQKSRDLEAKVLIIRANFDDVEREIIKLEKESKELELLSKKIKNELKLMEQEDKDRFAKKLEADKAEIQTQLNNNVGEISKTLTNKAIRIENELQQFNSQNTEDFIKYKGFKKSRDVQCTRMTQASNVLEELRHKRGSKDWLEVLVAERLLLETSENVKLLNQQIRDNTYTIIPEPPLHKGTIRLSDIKFPFSKPFRGNSKKDKHFTDFFVMTVASGTQMFVSEFITGESDPLSFSGTRTFENVTPDFEIKIQLFCLRLRTAEEYFWGKFVCYNSCKTSQIIYEDILTHDTQEKTVYKTSFRLCAETTLTKSHINENSASVNTKSDVFCKLDKHIGFNLKCDDIDIVADLSGFLDVGTLCGETYFWEKKWCVLNGSNLFIYNYPQDEDLGQPFEQISLEYCFGSIVTKVENCPKRRSFHLRTGRPSGLMTQHLEDSIVHTLKTKPNFALRKFYFAASNLEEYIRWTVELEKILNSLKDFKKLAFGEEYAVYMKH